MDYFNQELIRELVSLLNRIGGVASDAPKFFQEPLVLTDPESLRTLLAVEDEVRALRQERDEARAEIARLKGDSR